MAPRCRLTMSLFAWWSAWLYPLSAAVKSAVASIVFLPYVNDTFFVYGKPYINHLSRQTAHERIHNGLLVAFTLPLHVGTRSGKYRRPYDSMLHLNSTDEVGNSWTSSIRVLAFYRPCTLPYNCSRQSSNLTLSNLIFDTARSSAAHFFPPFATRILKQSTSP